MTRQICLVPHVTRWAMHLDSLVMWATGEYPDDGISLIACDEGQWYLAVDFGEVFNQFEGIFRHDLLPYRAPIFFESEEAAQAFAIECIKVAYPQLQGRDLMPWFKDSDC